MRDAAGSPVQAPPWKDPGSMGIDMKTHGKSLVLYGFTWVLNMDNMVLWYGDMMKYNFNILRSSGIMVIIVELYGYNDHNREIIMVI